jgi:xanthine/CO dehydrogenase XdhC/CoxF family maturation factor
MRHVATSRRPGLTSAAYSVRSPSIDADIGAELPAAIALSVMAEIHAVLHARNAHPLVNHG